MKSLYDEYYFKYNNTPTVTPIVTVNDIITCIHPTTNANPGDEFTVYNVTHRNENIPIIHYTNGLNNYKFELGSIMSKSFTITLKSMRKRKLMQLKWIQKNLKTVQ